MRVQQTEPVTKTSDTGAISRVLLKKSLRLVNKGISPHFKTFLR